MKRDAGMNVAFGGEARYKRGDGKARDEGIGSKEWPFKTKAHT